MIPQYLSLKEHPWPRFDLTSRASQIVHQAAQSLELLAQNIGPDFVKIIEKILDLKGRLILSGIGKSGYIARKISASFASTGTPAFYLHPAEASHGDLGMITQDDLVILLSNSGQTTELNDVMSYCKNFAVPIVGITMNEKSQLAQSSNYLLLLPKCKEVSNLNAPTISCSLMLALGDALMSVTHECKNLTANMFQSFHPGGQIGASLMPIGQLMHRDGSIPVASPETIMSEVIIIISHKGFGSCAILENNRVVGIITDGDLRRHINTNMLISKAKDIMTKDPKVLTPEVFASTALKIMNDNNITSCLVVENDQLVGILHIHDLLRYGL